MRSLPLLRQWVGALKLIRLAERETEDCVMCHVYQNMFVCLQSGCFERRPQESKNGTLLTFSLNGSPDY